MIVQVEVPRDGTLEQDGTAGKKDRAIKDKAKEDKSAKENVKLREAQRDREKHCKLGRRKIGHCCRTELWRERQGKETQNKAGMCKTKRSTAGQGGAMQAKAWRDGALGQSVAAEGKARQDEERRGRKCVTKQHEGTLSDSAS